MKRILYYLFLLFLSLPLVAQEYTQLTNLPTVYIETKNKAAVTSKKDFVNATWKMVDGNQVVTLTDMKIRCRGNSLVCRCPSQRAGSQFHEGVQIQGLYAESVL